MLDHTQERADEKRALKLYQNCIQNRPSCHM